MPYRLAMSPVTISRIRSSMRRVTACGHKRLMRRAVGAPAPDREKCSAFFEIAILRAAESDLFSDRHSASSRIRSFFEIAILRVAYIFYPTPAIKSIPFFYSFQSSFTKPSSVRSNPIFSTYSSCFFEPPLYLSLFIPSSLRCSYRKAPTEQSL